MIHVVEGLDIRGIVAAVPQQVAKNLLIKSAADVVRMIGVHERRVADRDQHLQDFARPAARHLLQQLGWGSDVDVLIVVTQTPSQKAPAEACRLQHALKLFTSCAAFDINLGCSGFTYGLWVMGRLLGRGQRGLLVTGDLTRQYIDLSDRVTGYLFGDCVAVTAVERHALSGTDDAHFILGTDGSSASKLEIPVSPPVLRMDGAAVFQFTLRQVPAMYQSLFPATGDLGANNVPDIVLLHQANAMIVKHLGQRMPAERGTPCNIERWGNTSSSSIPLLICDVLAHSLRTERLRVGMFGYGIGLSWAGVDMRLGPIKTLEILEV